jgi:hypothetical protein
MNGPSLKGPLELFYRQNPRSLRIYLGLEPSFCVMAIDHCRYTKRQSEKKKRPTFEDISRGFFLLSLFRFLSFFNLTT